jgi:hypothetical protein
MHYEIRSALKPGCQLTPRQRISSHFSETPVLGAHVLRRGVVAKLTPLEFKNLEKKIAVLLAHEVIEAFEVDGDARKPCVIHDFCVELHKPLHKEVSPEEIQQRLKEDAREFLDTLSRLPSEEQANVRFESGDKSVTVSYYGRSVTLPEPIFKELWDELSAQKTEIVAPAPDELPAQAENQAADPVEEPPAPPPEPEQAAAPEAPPEPPQEEPPAQPTPPEDPEVMCGACGERMRNSQFSAHQPRCPAVASAHKKRRKRG